MSYAEKQVQVWGEVAKQCLQKHQKVRHRHAHAWFEKHKIANEMIEYWKAKTDEKSSRDMATGQ